MNKGKIIAVCGLICSDCKIYKAPNNPEIAKELVAYFEGQWENVKMEDFHCNGCRDALDCWSTDCWIRDCCTIEKSLDFCFQCQEFACEKLDEWAKNGNEYKRALDNLKRMRRDSLESKSKD